MTEIASKDLDAIYTYIANVLCSPETARQQCSRIVNKIASLETYPKRTTLHYLKNNFQYYQLQVDNYTLFYTVSEQKKTVVIFRILYSSANLIARLENGHSLTE